MVPPATAELKITPPEGLDDRQLRSCARLTFEAGHGYYDLIEADRGFVLEQIEKQVGQSGTELEKTFVFLVGSEVAGLHACVSTDVLPSVMMEGSLRLVRGLDREVCQGFLRRLRQDRPTLPDLPEESLYLARIAVANDYRGLGVAEVLMEDLFGRRERETSYCLHVLTENARALRFFQRLGFEQYGAEKGGFLAMVCPAAAGAASAPQVACAASSCRNLPTLRAA